MAADDPTERALALLALLQPGTSWPAGDLAARLGTSERTVRRDAARLRRLGYAVEARPGPGSEYRLVPGTVVPPLPFAADEVTALAAGLSLLRARLPGDDAAARALAKLDQVLPPSLRARVVATTLATEVLERDGSPVRAADVGLVADAVTDGRIRFGYVDQHGVASTRLVDPYRHVLNSGHWYLVGFDVDRADWRLFRFDRVSEVERVPGVFARREFPDASVQHWFETDFGRL